MEVNILQNQQGFLHTNACMKEANKYQELVDQYTSHYPNHCRQCRGWGYLWGSFDPSPAGVSLSAGTMQDIAVCECIEDEGKCPRCGNLYPKDTDGNIITDPPCPICGFQEGVDEGLPFFECICPPPV